MDVRGQHHALAALSPVPTAHEAEWASELVSIFWSVEFLVSIGNQWLLTKDPTPQLFIYLFIYLLWPDIAGLHSSLILPCSFVFLPGAGTTVAGLFGP
jgi:hypothetical protein